MRLLLICNQFPKASESFIVNKLRGLLDRGWDVHIGCNRSDDEQWELYRHALTREDVAGRVHVGKDTLELVAELRPDLVHFEFAHFARGRAEAVRAQGVLTVASLRGNDVNHTGLEDEGFFDEVWSGSDALHVLTEDVFARAVRRGCPPDKRHAVVTPAVDVRFFDPDGRGYDQRVGTKSRPLRILSVGRLHWMKGHVYGIAAVRQLVDRGIHCDVRIVGRADYGEARIETVYAIHDLGLESVVTLMDAQPHTTVRELLAWADVALQPSVSEGFCNAGLEAQAMAVPVVTTTSLRENVVHGKTGYVLPSRDATALADAMHELARRPSLRRAMGTAGRERACTRFRLDMQAEAWDAFYRDLLGVPGTAEDDEAARLAAEIEQEAVALAALEGEHATVVRELQREEDLLHTRKGVASLVPADAVVAIVSRGDDELLDIPVRSAVHFPQAADGSYAGHHPASSEDAIRQLEALRVRGAEYLVFPATGMWWLNHYEEFRAHLDATCRPLSGEDDPFVIYEIVPAAVPAVR